MAVKESRAFDALFDTTYTVSGARDHYKQQGQAGLVLQQVPEHANFFSVLGHYPKSTFRVKANTQLPDSVDRNFHPHQHIPQLLKWQSSPQRVIGPQLFKYFKRPLLPAGATLTMSLKLAPQQPAQQAPPPPPEPASKDAGTQSDYRESEAQTLPGSPDWVLPTNPAVLAKQAALCAKFSIAGPEVLQLAHLTFGNGLPGGLQEVRRLEKLRAKRAFEASLPAIDDVARLPERQAMIEAWEVQEWMEREEEIKGVQEERLSLLAQALQVREEEIEAAHREQVQKRSSALLAAKANKFAAIHTERLKAFRQLSAAKDKVAGTLDRRAKSSIIQQYADYGSAMYAPPQREGHFPDVIPAGAATAGQLSHCTGTSKGVSISSSSSSPTKQLHPAMFAPSSIAGLTELEASLPKKALSLKASTQQQQQRGTGQPQKLTYKQRQQAAAAQDVATIHDMLQAAKAATGTRGIGKVWPCPLDDGPASAAVLTAAAAAAAADGQGSSRHGMRSAGARSGGASLAAAAAAAAAATGGAPARSSHSARVAAARAGAANAASSQVLTDAPPLPDPEGTHAALVLLQRLLRGRAAQSQMYAGKESRLLLIRELRLGLEGTGGGQQRPEVRDAGTQERDAAAGAALCRLCCLLASDDQAGIATVLAGVAARRQQQEQRQQSCQQLGVQQQEQQQQEQPPQAQEDRSLDNEQEQQKQEQPLQVQEDQPVDKEQELQEDQPVAGAAGADQEQEQQRQQAPLEQVLEAVGQLQLTEQLEGQSSAGAAAGDDVGGSVLAEEAAGDEQQQEAASAAGDDQGDSMLVEQTATVEPQQAGQDQQQAVSGEQLQEQKPQVEVEQEAAVNGAAAPAGDDQGDSMLVEQTATVEPQQAGQDQQQAVSGEQLQEQEEPQVEVEQEAAIAQEASKQASALGSLDSSSSMLETDAEPPVVVQDASAEVADPVDGVTDPQ